jgi:hypothetical protein
VILLLSIPRLVFSQVSDPFWEEQPLDDELPQLLTQPKTLAKSSLGYDLNAIFESSKDLLQVILSDTLAKTPRFRINYQLTGESLDRQLLKSEYSPNDRLKFQFLSENDPGEKWGDFLAFNVTYEAEKFKCIAGHYSAGFAQGLVLWRNFEWSPYPEAPIAPLKSDFLRGYFSTGENSALFGIGSSYDFKNYTLMFLYSDTRLDAKGNAYGVTTLQTSGEHTTASQIEDEDRLREKLVGLRLRSAVADNLKLGISAIAAHYTPPFAYSEDDGEEFDFTGDHLEVAGFDYDYKYKAFSLAGELAKTSTEGLAVINRALYSAPSYISEVQLRYLSPEFKNYRSPYPEGDETGGRITFSSNPWLNGKITSYYDYGQKEWRTSNYDSPPSKSDVAFCAEQKWRKYLLSIRFRETESGDISENLTRKQFRITMKRESELLSTTMRLERMVSVSAGEIFTGYLASIRLSKDLLKGRAEFSLSSFRIPDWDCRIYLYEPDIPGRLSVEAFQGNGTDVNLVYKVKAFNYFEFAGRFGSTYYSWKPNDESGGVEKNLSLYLEFRF